MTSLQSGASSLKSTVKQVCCFGGDQLQSPVFNGARRRGLTNVSAQHPSLPVATQGSLGRGLPWGLASLHSRNTASPGPLLGVSGRGSGSRVVGNRVPEAGGSGSGSAPGAAPSAQCAAHAGKAASAAQQRACAHCSPKALQHQRGPRATRHRSHRGTEAGRPLRRTKAGPGEPEQLLPQQVGN